MTVEILMATRNSADFLEKMLKSLLTQTETNFHLVISDDVSTDETLAIIDRIASRFRNPVRVIRRTEPSGSAQANFSFLLEQSTADYVFLADHDDIWLPEKVAEGLARLRAAEERLGADVPLMVHSDLSCIDETDQIIASSYWAFKNISPSAGAHLPSALMHATVTGCAMAVNRALVKKAGQIPPDAIMHDWWLNLVAVALGEVIWDSTPRIHYRIHGANVSRPRAVSISSSILQLDRLGRLRRNLRRRYVQGQALRDRYQGELDPARQRIMDRFSRVPGRPIVLRQASMIRNGFLWPGVWRNVIQLAFA